MNKKGRFARFCFALTLCVGLGFSLTAVRTCFGSECWGSGSECQNICQLGYFNLQSQCEAAESTLNVYSVGCNGCNYPGGTGGMCDDGFTFVTATCY